MFPSGSLPYILSQPRDLGAPGRKKMVAGLPLSSRTTNTGHHPSCPLGTGRLPHVQTGAGSID